MKFENLKKLWNAMEYLTEHEAAALICEVVPYSYAEGSGEARAIKILERRIFNAMEGGELESVDIYDVPHEYRKGNELWYTTQEAARKWCERSRLDPGFLSSNIESKPVKAPRPHAAAENSLVAMVAALVSIGGHDLAAPHSQAPDGITEKIAQQMKVLGIERPPESRTIAKWLAKARDMLEG